MQALACILFKVNTFNTYLPCAAVRHIKYDYPVAYNRFLEL